ncbi:hypothetical protein ACN4EG_18520 [Alkalinema pantanalense CENA528]|uniref:hypothetical protein n=1 Tax=Alkalinema pantanalense TaxID=1620705 RepID=UPI003D6EA380
MPAITAEVQAAFPNLRVLDFPSDPSSVFTIAQPFPQPFPTRPPLEFSLANPGDRRSRNTLQFIHY